ncbi:MAG: 4-(cytidine 5'-diphospho)-2-C-methyl-D-erythritol kinase [Chloroflexi bacterium]|nr:4-(cytidine 5'-diphospho)-2-C-methyl-D-erythritol kinase [Chloroflexota bacterium]
MTKLTLKAPAKINLTLEILGRREDGYHDIATIMQAIDLCDTVTLEPDYKLSLACDRPELDSPDNLALRAAHALRDAARCDRGARIGLQKAIPVSAGLGGGSSDAAAVLKGLNRLWGLGLTIEELTPIAARLGSDVPFFLHGGTAMAQGRGERVRPMPPADIKWIVLLCPKIELASKTASLYRRLAESSFTQGGLTRKLEARIRGGGDVPAQFLFNAFDEVALEAFPGLEDYYNTFVSLGASEVHLAGSGPSMFALVERRELGTAMHLLMRHRYGWDAFLVSPWTNEEAAS